jgi:RHS repeat-associated protein
MSKDKLLVMFLLFQSPKSKQKACPNKLPPVRQCLGGQHTKLLLVSKVGFRQEFVLRDYLGNARVHFSDLNGDGALQPFACNPAVPCVPLGNGGGYTEMLQVQHYYPFGMEFDGPWEMPLDPDEINHYTYNGKELNRDFGLGWLDYGARWYDPAVGRFPSVDPLPDQFAWVSPFNYAENDPVQYVDLWGLQHFLAGGWRGAVGLNDISSAVKFFKDGKLVYGALKSAQAINSGSNVFDFGDELMQSIPYSGSETPSSDNKGGE